MKWFIKTGTTIGPESQIRISADYPLFSLDFSASDTTKFTGVSVRSINTIFIKLRIRSAEECEKHAHFAGQIEVDESYLDQCVFTVTVVVVRVEKPLSLVCVKGTVGFIPRSFLTPENALCSM